MSPYEAYDAALMNPNADIKNYLEIACKNPFYAYLFALDIPNADIEKCQEIACKNPHWAYHFAKNVPEANIEYCLTACKDTKQYYELLKELPQIMAKQLINSQERDK